MGRSGAGKTTLLKCIYGLEDISDGQVTWKDELIIGPSERLIPGFPAFRFVRQDFDLAHSTTVYLNIKQTLRGLEDAYKASMTSEMLELCRLSHLKDQKVETLSGGEKQRLAIARALAPEPEMLILDEPFSNLDPINKAVLKEVLLDLKESKITLLLALHEPNDILELADDIVMMEAGSKIFEDSLSHALVQREDLLVGRLLGELNEIRWKYGKFIRPYEWALSKESKEGFLASGKVTRIYQHQGGFRAVVKDKKQKTWKVDQTRPFDLALGTQVFLYPFPKV